MKAYDRITAAGHEKDFLHGGGKGQPTRTWFGIAATWLAQNGPILPMPSPENRYSRILERDRLRLTSTSDVNRPLKHTRQDIVAST
jgi:hypothetical protein